MSDRYIRATLEAIPGVRSVRKPAVGRCRGCWMALVYTYDVRRTAADVRELFAGLGRVQYIEESVTTDPAEKKFLVCLVVRHDQIGQALPEGELALPGRGGLRPLSSGVEG